MTAIGHAKASFERDGATLIKSAVSIDWIERARLAVDLIMSDGGSGRNLGRDGEGRFFADQLLVKEPRALKPTPWHQDLPHWPLTGDQMLSIWVPLDPATPESGVVTYVRGSHLWGRTFPPEPFNKDDESGLHQSPPEAPGAKLYADRRMDLDDIRARPELYDFLTWNVEPGDVIIHHPLVVHGAPGNSSESRRRRALATRWIGDDVRWDDSHAHFMERFKSVENFPYPDLTRGDMVADERIFPLIWSCFSPGDSRN